MFKLLCLAALLAAASAQKCGRGTTLDADGYCVAVSQCGSGTVVDPATNKCVVAPTEDRARRENKEDPKIETLAKSLIFSVDEKASGASQATQPPCLRIPNPASRFRVQCCAWRIKFFFP